MADGFETMGNATILVVQDGKPAIATDPWLARTCYFGSWALDYPLTEKQIADVRACEWLWFSHGHPDHLHEPSLDLLPEGRKVLLADHYDPDIANFLRSKGFEVSVMAYRTWHDLRPGLRVMGIDNMTQDSILIVQVGDALLININDSPVAGEVGFLRRLVASHPNDKTYLFALCSVDADMFNFVDEAGNSLVRPAEERKPPEVWRVARRLGVRNFCCSSSQHIYARADSAWANPHRISWDDIRANWNQPEVRLIPPFVSVDLGAGSVTENHPSHQPDPAQFSTQTGDDDWSERLSETEWAQVAAFFAKFELLRKHMDYAEVVVGDELRRFDIASRPRYARNQRGVRFVVPRHSLLDAVGSGYFDDLLIGNFMKVSVTNMRLYPYFTPLVAKLGGNAKVFTREQYGRFRGRYFRRNPLGTLGYIWDMYFTFVVLATVGRIARALKIRPMVERIYYWMLRRSVRS